MQPCSSLSWSYPVLISGFQGLHVYLLFSLLGSIGETAWHLVSLQKHGTREWVNETILVEGAEGKASNHPEDFILRNRS